MKSVKLVLSAALSALALIAPAYSQNLDPGFSFTRTLPSGGSTQSMNNISLQPDGRILWEDYYYEAQGGALRRVFSRLNINGTPDQSFANPVANGTFSATANQADGRILTGGTFTTVDGVTRNRIARLNRDGSLDADFNPNLNSSVAGIDVQEDGRILIGGAFTTVGGVTRNRIARLNPDGTPDATFSADVNNLVNIVTTQADGKILLAGSFTTVNGIARNRMARLNADGSLDATFNPSPSTSPSCIAALPDGKILLGGSFTSVGGIARGNLARLNADGSLDPSFDPNVNGAVVSLAVQADGRILIGGSNFTTVGGVPRNRFARLNADGMVNSWEPDSSAGSLTGNGIQQIFLQADGKIICRGGDKITRLTNDIRPPAPLTVSGGGQIDWVTGGSAPELGRVIFQTWNGSAWASHGPAERVPGGWRKSGLPLPASTWARALGWSLATTPNNGFGAISRTMPYGPGKFPEIVVTRQGGGRIESGATTVDLGARNWGTTGSAENLTITNVGDATLSGLALSITGAGAADFIPSLLSKTSLAPGESTNFTLSFSPQGGGMRAATVSLASNDVDDSPFLLSVKGTCIQRDDSFSVTTDDGANSAVYSMVVQPDGYVLIGGTFVTINGVRRLGLARLRTDGAIDASFNPSVTGSISCMALQRDGGILIGGTFTSVGGVPRTNLARLNADGTLDPSFTPTANNAVSSFAIQNNGQIVVGGSFTSIGGVTRNRIARINPDGTLDATFNPDANSQVACLDILPDGRILAGGNFTILGGVTANRLGTLNADGTPGTGFNPNADGGVNSFALQSDGKLLLAGGFTTLGGVARNYVARLNADGTLDTAFNPNPNLPIFDTVVQADGKILLGAYFTTIGGVVRNSVARLNADGTLDARFNPDVSGTVYSIAQQADGRILIAGSFNRIAGVAQSPIARLLNDSPANQELAITAEGQIDWLRGGSAPELGQVTFQSWDGGAWVDYGPATRIAGGWRKSGLSLPLQNTWIRAQGRANSGRGHVASGVVSQTATLGTGGLPDIAMALEEAGELTSGVGEVDFGSAFWYAPIISKTFTITNRGDATLSGLGLSISGSGAADFLPGALSATALEPGESTSFTVQFSPQTDGIRAARLLVDSNDADELPFTVKLTGNFVQQDAAFNPAGISNVYSLLPLMDGKTLVGGDFTTVGGVVRNRLARLNHDGTPDVQFNPNANNSVRAIAVQADGKILIGGYFTTIGGVTRNCLARLNADGTLDPSFNPNLSSNPGDSLFVECLALQTDGKILIGGYFTKVGAITRSRIARLNVDGTLDTTFTATVNNPVQAIAIQPDGRILLGGYFTVASGGARNGIARVGATGILDASFNPNILDVRSLAIQADGMILIGGGFSTVGSVSRNNIARVSSAGVLDPTFNPDANGYVHSFAQQADGRILMSGGFTTVGGVARNKFARLNADGTLDLPFNPPASGSLGLALQADGQILMGGTRLLNNISPVQQLQTTGTQMIEWLRGGSAPEVEQVVFDVWSGTAWTTLGSAARIAGGWRKDGLSLPPGSTWVRARGRITNGLACGSSAIIEQISRTSFSESPDISVSAGGDPFTSGRDAVDFGTADWFTNGVAKTFTLTNSGNAPLNGLALSMSAGDSADFFAGALGATTLAPGASTTFAVTFTPKGGATRESTLSVTSNDGDESPFNIQLTGRSVQQDTSFNPNADGSVLAIANQRNGKILMGGSFTQINGVRRSMIARLNFDGSLDSSFFPNSNSPFGSSVNVISVQADEKILIAGGFTTIGGVQRVGIARLFADGALDPTFNPGASSVTGILPLQDGKILVAGGFNTIGGAARSYLARLNSDGTVDLGFNPMVGGQVNSLALQADGRILIGGYFETVGGVVRSKLARLNADGSLDAGFNLSPNSGIRALAIQPDGKVLIGGEFTSVAGVLRTSIARLNADGTLDPAFNPQIYRASGSSYSVWCMTLQADGKILVAGVFDTVGVTERNNLARLHPDGSVDLSFNPGPDSSVLSITQQAGGQILIGGAFTRVEGVSRHQIARLRNEPAGYSGLIYNQVNQINWSRSGSEPELGQVLFEAWNGSAWTPLGAGTRVAGGWQLNGVATSATSLRAWGRISGGSQGNGGSGVTGIVDLRSAGASRPEIEVRNPTGSRLYNNLSTVDYGSLPAGFTRTQTLTIRNGGDETLGYLATGKGGSGAAHFSVGNPLVSTLAPGASTQFTVAFNPGGAGAIHASLMISSNDAFNAPFEIPLAGFAYLEPEMAIEHPLGSELVSGGNHDFGMAATGNTAPKVFIIRNTGPGDLHLDSISIGGTHTGDFALTKTGTSEVVEPGGSTTLLVVFSPSAEGSRSAVLTITGSDADEGSFSLNLTGTGSAATAVPGGWVATGAMATARREHTATRLPNGKVLVAGGRNGAGTGLASAELYNPASGIWSPTGSMTGARFSHTATLLADGRLLVCGGSPGLSGGTGLAGAEIYDPATGIWNEAAPLSEARYGHTASLLTSGKVLVCGGRTDTFTPVAGTELFDPADGTWTSAGMLATPRFFHTASLLGNGKVLVVGGATGSGGSEIPQSELYDPVASLWAPSGSLIGRRSRHTATVLADGRVLAAGGSRDLSDQQSAEIYDPAQGSWIATGNLTNACNRHAAALMPDGQVLLTGGIHEGGLSTTQKYDPATGAWTSFASMISPRGFHVLTLLGDGTPMVTGGTPDSFDPINGVEIYDPNLLGSEEALAAFSNWMPVELAGASAAPTATPFNDGVPNLLKYAFNMNPGGPDVSVLATGGTSGLPQISVDSSGAEPVLKVAFLRRKGSGLIYTPQRSDTLGSFAAMTGTQTVTSIDAQWERVSVEEPAPPATAPSAFARVQVSLP